MSRLIAIDPGGYDTKTKTTGVATWANVPGVGYELVTATSMFAVDMLRMLFDDTQRPTIVYEGWRSTPYGRGGSTEPTARTIGALQWICDMRNLPATQQWPHDKPRALAWMAKQGIECVGRNQHARDAEMHGWLWLSRNGVSPK